MGGKGKGTGKSKGGWVWMPAAPPVRTTFRSKGGSKGKGSKGKGKRKGPMKPFAELSEERGKRSELNTRRSTRNRAVRKLAMPSILARWPNVASDMDGSSRR